MLPILIIAILVVADQLSKFIVLTELKPIYQITVIDNFFYLTYLENRGAAFGAMQGARWFFVALAVVVMAAGAIYYKKMVKTPHNLWLRTALLLICGGTAGNVTDRVFRGYVVDFLDFIIFGYDFPVFNIADVCIVLGTAILVGGILIFDGGEKV